MAIAIQLPSIDPKKAILAIIIALLFLVVFILGRNSKADPIQILPTDVSKYERKQSLDSVIVRDLRIANIKLSTINDSLKVKMSNNHKKVNSDVGKIKTFTYTSRNRWNDSTLRAAGLK